MNDDGTDTDRMALGHPDVVVVGGGLAGLTAAAVAARAGASVRVLDARSEPGGRARTATVDGFAFNEGPHAWFPKGPGTPVLAELGVAIAGRAPSPMGSRLSIDGRLRAAPPVRVSAQLAGWLAGLRGAAGDDGLAAVSTAEWLEHRLRHPDARRVGASLVRVATYAGDLTTLSADAAARQLRVALGGVTYLDGGWVSLVDGLRRAAETAGARVEVGVRVEGVRRDGDRWSVQATLPGGREPTSITARSVVLATGGPAAALRLLGPDLVAAAADAGTDLAVVADAARPVHAACLDLGLARLPEPRRRFALGVDRPTYASVHTPAARLAERGEVLHVAVYEPDAGVGTADLEAVATELQPGWPSVEMARQFGLRRVVAQDRPQPGRGLAGRPSVAVAGLGGMFLAGDWVGPTAILAAASVVSGRDAGRAAAA